MGIEPPQSPPIPPDTFQVERETPAVLVEVLSFENFLKFGLRCQSI